MINRKLQWLSFKNWLLTDREQSILISEWTNKSEWLQWWSPVSIQCWGRWSYKSRWVHTFFDMFHFLIQIFSSGNAHFAKMNARIHCIVIYLYYGFVNQDNCNVFYNGFVKLDFSAFIGLIKMLGLSFTIWLSR